MSKKEMLKNFNKNEQGQFLVFAIVAMTILLALGVGASVQTFSTIRDVSDIDTAQKSLAAAEGGAENFLSLTNAQLEDWSNNINRSNICNSLGGQMGSDSESDACIFNFDPQGSDRIGTRTAVRALKYAVTDFSPDRLVFGSTKIGQVKEVKMTGYGSNTIDVCWNDSNDDVWLYYVVWDVSGRNMKGIVSCHTDTGNCLNAFPDYGGSVDTTSVNDGSVNGYDSCVTIDNLQTFSNLVNLRLYPISAAGTQSIEMAVFPTPGSLPNQGYQITSEGSLQAPSDIQIVKNVTVYKSLPYLPGIFDFALYADDGILLP